MIKIPSFQIDHNKLQKGIYVSRKDSVANGTVTTFDVRMTLPNREQALSTGVMHTIEHIGATYLRNCKEVAEHIVYFGPMGCRTGFYLLVSQDITSKDIWNTVLDMFRFISTFEGEIPGAKPKDCGNYSDMDLEGAKKASIDFLTDVPAICDANHSEYPI